ncbi:TonB-dependent receptor [Neptuniibacter sp. CAU 1671]|uniref:TonB-dependent receptor n=1 Tax=Neptuniibacter sp. CAU 1671 TaxID=3032593 RepID=UPI0023DC0977|nr:TonB-dependent receptor [Neptuniibacter sp. CAU 1671]MDF2182396.1 TonB-dependent receptor [Neptuniibacter sp. CAU 1671]
MESGRIRPCWSHLFFTCLGLPNISTVYAEELMPVMIVTASRDDELNTEVPVSIGVVSQQQLSMDQGAHIQDSTRQMAGVTINQISGSSSHNTGIRMPLNYDGYYLFLQDNVPLQSAAFFNHNGLRWSSFNTSASQIEVLKGAGSTLYGSGAVAATVNIISEEPGFRPEGKLYLQAGENDAVQTRLSYTDAISDDQSLLIATSYLQDNGWRDHTARDRKELLLKHLWLLDDRNEIKTQFQTSRSNDEMATSLSADDYRTDPTLSGLGDQVLAIDPIRESDFARLSVEWTHFYSDRLELSLIPYWRYNTNDYVATWNSYTPQAESTVHSLGLLAKATYSHDNGSETLFGIDLERSDADFSSLQPFTVTISGWSGSTTYPEGFSYQDQSVRYSNLSPYMQHNYRYSDQLMLQAGIRYDHNRYRLDNHLVETDDDGFGNRQLADRTDSFNSLNPKLGFTYQLDQQQGIYGRLAQANRLPTASTLYNLKSGDSGSLVGGVEEETSTTLELGYRLQHSRGYLTLAVYRIDIDDAIVLARDGNDDTYRTNAGRVQHTGIEIETRYKLSPDWSAQLAFSHSRHAFDDYINNTVDYSGNELMLGPNNKGSASLLWHPTDNPKLNLELQLDYFGNYWMDDANSRRADGYTVAHLKTRYQLTPDLQLLTRIENLFDRDYAYQSELSWGREMFYPGAPLTVSAALEYRW